MNLLETASVREKLSLLEANLHEALTASCASVPQIPARDVELLPAVLHPRKALISTCEGQARLLHDLASIELQAMELALRTLLEFPEAPPAFRRELADIAAGEGRHLGLCLDGLESLGYAWGDWPVHTALWEATSTEDSLLDRLVIVHRYLEGSGLDAGDSILRRLSGVESKIVRAAVNVIVTEEVGHVLFGSEWYRRVCREERIDPSDDFPARMRGLLHRLPKRMEAIHRPSRTAAGFEAHELDFLEGLRRERLERTQP